MVEKPLYDKESGVMIARDHVRIEHGGRGDYYEIDPKDMVMDELYVPDDKKWKLDLKNQQSPIIDYIEYRTLHNDIKVYYQVNTQYVDYANYKIHFFYISTIYVSTKKPSNLDNYLKNNNNNSDEI